MEDYLGNTCPGDIPWHYDTGQESIHHQTEEEWGDGDVTQWVAHLVHMYEALSLIPSTYKLGMMVNPWRLVDKG